MTPKKDIPAGVVHSLPDDLRKALVSTPAALALWESLTPLGRNEFICWIESAKLAETRAHRIQRTLDELAEGKRRPCCWAGCKHRKTTGRKGTRLEPPRLLL